MFVMEKLTPNQESRPHAGGPHSPRGASIYPPEIVYGICVQLPRGGIAQPARR